MPPLLEGTFAARSMPFLDQKLQKSLPIRSTRITRQSFNETNWSYPDSFKINSTHNTVGLINCLLQPGLFYLRILKSMREDCNQLIKSCATRTVSCCRDKVSKVASRRASCHGFCSATRQFYRDTEILPTYRDHAIWTVLS
jgi:hypothetical protein